MAVVSTFWRSKFILWERAMLRYYGILEVDVMKADGSWMARAFMKGWSSALRRKK